MSSPLTGLKTLAGMRWALATDPGSRALQIAGMMRFGLLFLQGIVLVKAGVSLTLIGQIELILFVSNFMLFFWQNGGRNAMLSWVPDAGKVADRSSLQAVFVTMHIYGLIAAVLLALIAHLPLGEQYDILAEEGIWIWLSLYVLLTIPATPMTYAYLFNGKLRQLLWYEGVTNLLQIGVVLVVILTSGSLLEMVRWLAIFAAARWCFVLIAGRWFSRGVSVFARVGVFFVFALPLVLYALSGGLMDYADGYIVSIFFGEDQFALYRYGAREFPVNALIIGGLVSGLIPKYRTSGGINPADLKNEINRLMRILFPLNCLLLLISPLLYTWLFNAEFTLSARIFNIYALTLVSRVVINQVYLYVFHHNWVLMISTIGEVVINVILSIILLQSMGLIGVPVATAIAYLLHKIFLVVFVQTRMKVSLAEYAPVRQYTLYTVAMVACFLAAEWIYFS